MAASSLPPEPESVIVQVADAESLQKVLSKASPSWLVLVDIDDTIITPRALLFRDGEGQKFLDDLKKRRAEVPNFEHLITQWRLSRQVQLVFLQWPSLIQKIHRAGASIYALTQIDTGRSGSMESIEKWRYQELHRLGIHFSPAFLGQEEWVLGKPAQAVSEAGLVSPAVFYKGLFLTGGFTKGQIVRFILAKLASSQTSHPSKIIFIDDRLSHVKDVQQVCKVYKIPYIGIAFRGVEGLQRLPFSSNLLLKIKQWQKEAFMRGEWKEDEEIEKLLQSPSKP